MNRTLLMVLTVAASTLVMDDASAQQTCRNCVKLAMQNWPGCPANSILVSSPNSQASDIQLAINLALPGDVLCVAPDHYYGTLDFNGQEITLMSQAGPYNTIIDAQNQGPVVTFQNGEDASTLLDGFTLQNGVSSMGGGIYILNASPYIEHNIIQYNTAAGGAYSSGGGVYTGGIEAHPIFTCNTIMNNKASYSGGGFYAVHGAVPLIRDTSLERNSADYGGGLSVAKNADITVDDSDFYSNRAIDGGAVHVGVTYGRGLLRGCLLVENSASANGGGAWVPAGFLNLINSVLHLNNAFNGGGLGAGYGSMVNVASTLFVSNTTVATNGAILEVVPTNNPSNTSIVNHYNGFDSNNGNLFAGTYGNIGILTGDPQWQGCYALTGSSPYLDTGIPDTQFDDTNGTPNDMGAFGGPY